MLAAAAGTAARLALAHATCLSRQSAVGSLRQGGGVGGDGNMFKGVSGAQGSAQILSLLHLDRYKKSHN